MLWSTVEIEAKVVGGTVPLGQFKWGTCLLKSNEGV